MRILHDIIHLTIYLSVVFTGKVEPSPHTSSFNMGYIVSPYGYANGASGPIPVSMVSRYNVYIYISTHLYVLKKVLCYFYVSSQKHRIDSFIPYDV